MDKDSAHKIWSLALKYFSFILVLFMVLSNSLPVSIGPHLSPVTRTYSCRLKWVRWPFMLNHNSFLFLVLIILKTSCWMSYVKNWTFSTLDVNFRYHSFNPNWTCQVQFWCSWDCFTAKCTHAIDPLIDRGKVLWTVEVEKQAKAVAELQWRWASDCDLRERDEPVGFPSNFFESLTEIVDGDLSIFLIFDKNSRVRWRSVGLIDRGSVI